MRLAAPGDLDGMVDVHLTAFPDYFLSHLGSAVLHRYYSAYLVDPTGVNVVATSLGRVRSFAVGTSRQSSTLDSFYKGSLLLLTWSVLKRLAVLDRVVINGLLPRRNQIGPALKAFLRRRTDQPQMRPREVVASLVSIATDPAYQGTSMSAQVLALFEAQVLAQGTSTLHLSVGADNARALAFYAKSGWIVIGGHGGALALAKYLD